MKEPTYQQALSKAWQMTWHHKNLWVLGLLAAFLSQFGLSDFFGKLWLFFNKGIFGSSSITVLQSMDWTNLSQLNWYNILGMVWLAGLLILILIAIVFLAVTSQGALIVYASSWYKNKRFSNLAKAWHHSVKHFWPMLQAVVLYKIFFVVLLLLASCILCFSDKAGDVMINLFLGLILGIILTLYLIVSVVYIYTLAYIVIDNKKLIEAKKSAWQLFSKHLIVSLEIALLLIFFNLILISLLATLLLIAFIPSLIIWIFAGIFNLTGLATFGFAVGLFIWITLAVLMMSVYNAFNISVWTYLFTKMHKEGLASRIVHHLGKILKRN